MFRSVLVSGCLVAAWILAGSLAWAEPPSAGAAPAAPVAPPSASGQNDAPPPGADAATAAAAAGVSDSAAPPPPPNPAANAEASYGGITPGMVDRAVHADAFRSEAPLWQGQARLRYRGRFTSEDDASDHDLYAYLKLKYRDEMLPGWSASFHGRATLDIGSFGNRDGFHPFDSITDTYEHRLNGRIYHAYVNYRSPRSLVEEVRLGRQYSDVGEFIRYDGVRATSRPLGCGWWQVSAFGGVPSYLFDDGREGDWTVGGSVKGRPWRATGVTLSYTHAHDQNAVYGHVDDNFVDLTVDQRIGMNTLVRGTYQQLNADPRALRLIFDTFFPARDVTVRGSFYSVLSSQTEAVYDFDYYYAEALSLEPYWLGTLAVSKGLGDLFTVEAGVNERMLYDQADEGTFNREFTEVYGTVASSDWLLRDLRLALTGEWWKASGDRIWTATFDLDWRPCPAWRLRLGTDYAAYRYDLFTNSERVHDLGGFVRVTWRPRSCWEVDVRLRVDDDDDGTWTQLDAGLTFDF